MDRRPISPFPKKAKENCIEKERGPSNGVCWLCKEYRAGGAGRTRFHLCPACAPLTRFKSKKRRENTHIYVYSSTKTPKIEGMIPLFVCDPSPPSHWPRYPRTRTTSTYINDPVLDPRGYINIYIYIVRERDKTKTIRTRTFCEQTLGALLYLGSRWWRWEGYNIWHNPHMHSKNEEPNVGVTKKSRPRRRRWSSTDRRPQQCIPPIASTGHPLALLKMLCLT